jgi:hypothetical protein
MCTQQTTEIVWKQKLIELKGEIENSTISVEDFSTLPSKIERTR